MEFQFNDDALDELYYDPSAKTGLGPAVDKGFRKAIGFIAAAKDELDLRNYKGLHYHKLSGDRSHQHGLDITDKYRLIVERIVEDGRVRLLIIEITDYH
ncbi:type II toxin-antitoxin system RelE/ParE family toxin [bacterium]|nr:type II toxin-antitoxin system RelE/ParE family toxin [bacterium]